MSIQRACPAAPGEIDFERALIDPAAAFATPDAVLRDVCLSTQRKLEILCRWAYDSVELAVAEEEGMDGGESLEMSAVLRALGQLSDVDVQHCAPTKHAAFCVAPVANGPGIEPPLGSVARLEGKGSPVGETR